MPCRPHSSGSSLRRCGELGGWQVTFLFIFVGARGEIQFVEVVEALVNGPEEGLLADASVGSVMFGHPFITNKLKMKL